MYDQRAEVESTPMKVQKQANAVPVFPQHIRTYLIANVALAVLMAVVMAVRTELRSGHFLFIDIFLIIFYASVLASLTVGPFALIEIYLYRKKKGVWYEWKNGARRLPHQLAANAAQLQHWRSEALRARLARGAEPSQTGRNRTRLFERNDAADPVSRAALLMTVADKLERSGKREAAERCYLQITQRFAGSPQAQEAAQRLSGGTKVDTSRGRY
jgi:hypothetical protein